MCHCTQEASGGIFKCISIFFVLISSNPVPSVSGAYLVPYFILLLLIGIPLFFLELAVGQRIRRGSIGVWNYVYPQLGGIGVSSLMVRAFFLFSSSMSTSLVFKLLY